MEDLLAEQKEYYRTHAASYDHFGLEKSGVSMPGNPVSRAVPEILPPDIELSAEQIAAALPPDTPPEMVLFLSVGFRENSQVVRDFSELPLGDDVLELAAGTGNWTQRIVRRATRVTVVEASPEMVAENLARLGSLGDTVHYKVTDIFDWVPDRQYSAVVFGFWISHVPRGRMDRFLSTVHDALVPGGSVFFVDDKLPSGRTPEPVRPEAAAGSDIADADVGNEEVEGREIALREVADGRVFRIVKNYWDPSELAERCRRSGLEVEVRETDFLYQYGIGHRAD